MSMNPFLKKFILKTKKSNSSSSLMIVSVDKSQIDESIQAIANIIFEESKDYIKIPDVFGIFLSDRDKRQIGIEEIHEFSRKAQLKPFSHSSKIGVIEDCDEMTHEAQNALLKLLEEPPSGTILILTSTNSNALLKTIVSRCKVFYLKEVVTSRDLVNKDLDKFLTSGIVTRLEQIELMLKEKDKSVVRRNVSELLLAIEQKLRTKLISLKFNSSKISQNIELVELTRIGLERNVNQRLALENMAVNLDIF